MELVTSSGPAVVPERPTLRGWIANVTEDVDGELPVNSIRVQGRTRSTESWKTLVDVRRKRNEELPELQNRVETEVANQTSRQIQVIAFRRQGRAPISTYPIIADIYGDDDDDDDELLTKGKAGSEVIKQTLRHNEILVHAMMKMCQSQNATMATIVQRYETREAASEARHLEAIEALRTMKHADREGEIEQAKWKAITSSAQEMVSAVAYRLTEGKGGPPDAKAQIMSSALRRLGAGLTETQMETIGGALTPSQAAILRSLLEDPDGLATEVQSRQATIDQDQTSAPAGEE